MIASLLGGALIYMFLGNIADLVFNCSYFMVTDVLLAEDGGLLTNFDFLIDGTTLYSGFGLSEDVMSKFLSLVYLLAWVMFTISAAIAIIKVLANQTRNASGAGIKVAMRILITATFLSCWFPTLQILLVWVTKLLKGTLYSDTSILSMTDLITQLKTNGASNINLIDWNDAVTNAPSDYILECILAFSLGSSLIACVITYIERYVAFAFYIYLSPFSIALAANEDTSDNLKTWLTGLFPQIVCMVVSVLFMVFGLEALAKDGSGGTDAASVCFKCAIGMVFFGLSRSTEKLFGTLGFKTTHVGDAAKSALAGTAQVMTAWSFGKSMGGAAGNAIAKTDAGMAIKDKAAGGLNTVTNALTRGKFAGYAENKANAAKEGIKNATQISGGTSIPNGQQGGNTTTKPSMPSPNDMKQMSYQQTKNDTARQAMGMPPTNWASSEGKYVPEMPVNIMDDGTYKYTHDQFADTPEDQARFDNGFVPKQVAIENGTYEGEKLDGYSYPGSSAINALDLGTTQSSSKQYSHEIDDTNAANRVISDTLGSNFGQSTPNPITVETQHQQPQQKVSDVISPPTHMQEVKQNSTPPKKEDKPPLTEEEKATYLDSILKKL